LRTRVVLVPLLLLLTVSWFRADQPPGDRTGDPLDAVRNLREDKQYAEAEALGREQLALAERQHGAESLEVALTLDVIVSLSYASAGAWDAPDLLELAERAVRIKKTVLPPGDMEHIVSMRQLANVLDSQGRHDDALPLRLQILEISAKKLGPEHRQLAGALLNAGSTYGEMGDLATARGYFERAIGILNKSAGPESKETTGTRWNLGELLVLIGDYAGARSIFEDVIRIHREHPDSVQEAVVARELVNYGDLLRKMGERDRAGQLLEEGLERLRKLSGGGKNRTAGAMGKLAELRRDAGDLAGARSLQEEALKILSPERSARHPRAARAMTSLASTMLRMGDFSSAQTLAEEALGIQEEKLGPRHIQVADTLTVLARLRWYAGRLDEALDLALRAEQIVRDHFREISTNLSEREALGYETIRASGLDLAFSALAANGPSSSPKTIRRAWDQLVRSRALVLDEMAERAAAASDMGKGDEALVAALTRARHRLSRLIVQGADQGGMERYRAQVDQARIEKETAERALAGQSARFRAGLRRRDVTLTDVTTSLPDQAALVAYVRYEQPGRAPNAPSTAHYGALTMSSGHPDPRFIPLGDARTIDALVATWRKHAGSDPRAAGGADAEAAYREAASPLRDAIWAPVEATLHGTKMVLIVPDGAIHLVSFAALPGAGGRYLVDSDPLIHYLSAERDLASEPRVDSAPNGLLLVGAPDYDAAFPAVVEGEAAAGGIPAPAPGPPSRTRAACGDLRSLRFDPLPGSGAEAGQIETLWRGGDAAAGRGSVTRLVGAEAAEGKLKALAGSYRILHLATHGFFMQGRCESFIEGSRAQAGAASSGAPLPEHVTDDPLLLSGLAMAGANQRDRAGSSQAEDGMLTAEEMASLNLSGTQWVVLSACETGLGKVMSGEGVLGLRRSLEVAGAATVIMSLWKVEDDTTRAWMRGLYEKRLDGLSTAAAVRGASLQLLEALRQRGRSTHPFFWAGFVAAGDWR
jgi:CHAT domain-containing protein/tetratricopeptide (TPR) repeat protein